MNHLYTRYQSLRFIIDAPLLLVSYVLALKWMSLVSVSPFYRIDPWFALILVAAWYASALISNLYIDRRSNKFSEEIIFILYTLLLFTLLTGAVLFFLHIYPYYHFYFFIILNTLFFVIQTLVKYLVRRNLQFSYLNHKRCDNILLIGSTTAAKEFHNTISIHFYYGYKCVGILGEEKIELADCPYMGDIHQLSTVLQQSQIDEVVITLPNYQQQEIKNCIEICDYYGIRIKLIPDFHQYSSNSSKIEYIGLIPVVRIKDLPLDKQNNKTIKRSFDIIVSLGFIVLIATWLFPLIALLIKLNSKGPVFFRQERWGLNNRKIIMYKFRTMVHSQACVNETGQFIPTKKNDHRVTSLGKYLRMTSMDELPQFWNVLLGNMSIVGPRPHVTPQNIESIETIDNYLQRHLVKPGITGWAQVNGSRGDTNWPGAMENRVRFDLYYVNKWTFWLDCQIIIQTIINIVRGDQNAY